NKHVKFQLFRWYCRDSRPAFLGRTDVSESKYTSSRTSLKSFRQFPQDRITRQAKRISNALCVSGQCLAVLARVTGPSGQWPAANVLETPDPQKSFGFLHTNMIQEYDGVRF
ncbi:hypothetical protein J6590_094848, partial [Homalodisca vitripennis]